MERRHHRVFRLLASMVAAAALAAPVSAAAGRSGGSVATSSQQHSNAILRNDIAHYGTHRLSAPGASPVQRQSPAPIVVRVDGGFDWAAAGVGAAGALGLVLVAGSATSALRHNSKLTRRGPKAALTRGV